MPLVPVLERMEANRRADRRRELREQSDELAQRMREHRSRRRTTLAGGPFNLDSPKQLQEVLFDELKLPALAKTPTGQPSTNEDVLEELARPTTTCRA